MATYYAAFLLRFDGRVPARFMLVMLTTLPLVIFLKIAFYLVFKVHKGLWSHAGLDDLVRVIKACTFSTLVFMAAIGLLFRFQGFPRSVVIIDWILSILLLGGKRLILRVVKENMSMRGRAPGERTLIVGAGSAGEQAARELMTNAALGHEIAGFLDDDPHKQGMMIRGVSVLGTLSDAQRIIKKNDIAAVLLAIPSAGDHLIKRMVESCASLNVRLQILPAISDLISGKLVAQQIRDVRIEDLLQRDSVKLDAKAVKHDYEGKCVLVTGAGGSIGSELARQVAGYNPSHLILLDMAETPLFDIEQEIANAHPEVVRTAVIANIANGSQVEALFSEHRPQCVLHAAAVQTCAAHGRSSGRSRPQ